MAKPRRAFAFTFRWVMASDAPRKTSVLRKPVFALAGLLFVLAATMVWLLGTSSGARTALSLLPSLSGNTAHADGIDGRLAGPLRLRRLTVDTEGQQIVLSDVRLDWQPSALLRRELHILSLRADTLDIIVKPSTKDEPTRLPQTLALPLTLRADDVGIGRGSIRMGTTTLLTLGAVTLSASYDGAAYRLHLERLGAQSASGQNNLAASLKGDATLGATAPFALQARLASGAEAALGTQNLNASGEIRLDGTLEDIRLRSDLAMGEASLTGNAMLRPFSLQMLGVAALRAQAIDLAAFRSDLPATRLNLALSVQEGGNGKFVIDNPEAGPYDDKRLPLTRLLVDFRQQDGKYVFDNILAALGSAKNAAGEIKGTGVFADSGLTLALTTSALNLHHVDRRVQTTRLAGRADIRHADGRQELTLDMDQPLQKKKLGIAAHATLSDDLLLLDRFAVRLGEGSAEAKARVALNGTQEFDVSGTFGKFRSKDLGDFPNLPDVYLNGEFSAQGARSPAMTARFRFEFHDSRIAGQPLQGEGKGELRGNVLEVEKLTLLAGENRLNVQGRLADDKGNLVFTLHAPKLDILGRGFGGTLDVNGTAIGSFTAPRIKLDWNGSNVRLLDLLQFDGTQGNAQAQLDRNKPLPLTSAMLEASIRGLRSGERQAGEITLKGQFSPQPSAPLDVVLRVRDLRTRRADNTARADSLDISVRGTTASHVLDAALAAPGQSLSVNMSGGLSRLESAPQWEGTVQRVDGSGNLAAHLAQPSPLFLSAQRLQLDRFRLESALANIDVEQFLRDQNGIATRGRLQRFRLAQVLAFSAAEPVLSTDLVLSGEWDVRFGDTLDGTVKVQRDSGDIVMRGSSPVPLQLRQLQASAVATNDQIVVQARLEGERAGRIAADLRTGVIRNGTHVELSADAPLSGNIRGDLPSIGWIASLVSSNLLAEGSLQADVALNGTLAQPDLKGRIDGRRLRLLLASLGIDLRDGVLDGEFQGARLQVNRLSFGPVDKAVVAAGHVDFADRKPTAQFNVKANRFALFDRSDRRIIVSGSSDIAWSDKVARIAGGFQADSGFIDIGNTGMPQLADDVVIVGSKSKGEPSQRGLPAHIDVGIGLGDGITLKGRGLDAKLAGDIRLASEPGEPLRARGTLQVKSGTYKAYGRELAIERGLLRFNGPIDNPSLDILAMRRGQEVEAGVNVLGTVLEPRVTLVSEPTVSDADKLSWLVLGRALNDSSGGGDIAALQDAASSLLTQGAAAGVQSQIAQAFGLDELKVGTDSESTLQEHIVTLGKRISSKLYVSLEQGIETATSVLRLRYTLSRKLTVEAGAGTRSTILLFYNIAYD